MGGRFRSFFNGNNAVRRALQTGADTVRSCLPIHPGLHPFDCWQWRANTQTPSHTTSPEVYWWFAWKHHMTSCVISVRTSWQKVFVSMLRKPRLECTTQPKYGRFGSIPLAAVAHLNSRLTPKMANMLLFKEEDLLKRRK